MSESTFRWPISFRVDDAVRASVLAGAVRVALGPVRAVAGAVKGVAGAVRAVAGASGWLTVAVGVAAAAPTIGDVSVVRRTSTASVRWSIV
ncbi:MAG: hypothetical protein ABEJ74_04745 [Haloferacaceae archaeon]